MAEINGNEILFSTEVNLLDGGSIDTSEFLKKSDLDNMPREGSDKPVTSGGVFSHIKQFSIAYDGIIDNAKVDCKAFAIEKVEELAQEQNAHLEQTLESFEASMDEKHASKEEMKTVESVAKGANQALSFGSYEELVYEFNSLPDDKYKVGQNIYIQRLNVPDLWVSRVYDYTDSCTYTTDEDFIYSLNEFGEVKIGYYALSALETQKVDLTEYAKKEEIGDIETALDSIIAIQNSLIGGGA